jgi:hypothetical protein
MGVRCDFSLRDRVRRIEIRRTSTAKENRSRRKERQSRPRFAWAVLVRCIRRYLITMFLRLKSTRPACGLGTRLIKPGLATECCTASLPSSPILYKRVIIAFF